MTRDVHETADNPGTLIFAGGGSGGHIYPALAIAQSARALAPDIRVHLLCSERAIDRAILERADVAFTTVPAQPLILRPRGLARLLRRWAPAVRTARDVIDNARHDGPLHMVATGGFVSVPCVAAARKSGVGVTLVNLDRVPGLANRHVARRARRVFTAATLAPQVRARHAAWSEIRPIVRDWGQTEPREQLRQRFGLPADRRTLLVLGGSQGASSINRLLESLASEHRDWFAGWSVLHQCGAPKSAADDTPARLERVYADAAIPALVRPFLTDEHEPSTPTMGQAWAMGDLLIGRAGAGTVAEARHARVPAAFLPYPYHRDQHQRLNAMPLADAGGAVVLEDRIEPGATLAASGDTLRELLGDAGRITAMRRVLEQLPPCDGADAVARSVLDALRA